MSLLGVSLATIQERGVKEEGPGPCPPSCWPVQPPRSPVPTLLEFPVKRGRWLGKELRNGKAWVQILPQPSTVRWSCRLFILSKPLFPM